MFADKILTLNPVERWSLTTVQRRIFCSISRVSKCLKVERIVEILSLVMFSVRQMNRSLMTLINSKVGQPFLKSFAYGCITIFTRFPIRWTWSYWLYLHHPIQIIWRNDLFGVVVIFLWRHLPGSILNVLYFICSKNPL